MSLQSSIPNVLQEMLSVFLNRPFMFHHAKGFPQYAKLDDYEVEEAEFKNISGWYRHMTFYKMQKSFQSYSAQNLNGRK